MPWSSFNLCSISLAIALRCGSEVPEQMTKKFVKLEIPRRSRITISSAFLFEASSAQAFARSSGMIGGLLVKLFAMNNFLDCCRHEIANRAPGGNSLSDIGR